MSHGISVMILKESRNDINPEYLDVLKKRFDDKPKVGFPDFDSKSGQYPALLDSDTDTFDFLDSKTGIPYNIAFEQCFYSATDGLREYLITECGLNSFNPVKRGIIVDRNTAKRMYIAIKYLLLGHYDIEIEKLMDNEFIEVFGRMCGKYSDYKYHLMFPDDNEYSGHDEDSERILESLRNMFGVFLDTNEDDGVDIYRLYFEVWG